ncbi:hypothetical protein [Microbacterium soli]|uniref:Holin n=1 Tax=Microbacterium soli TaxID=446075 RepID=A0ABP7NI86_9MICO
MSTPTPDQLGSIITSARARRTIYAVYVLGIIIIGAVQVGFAAAQVGQPDWLTVALAVAAYLGVPVGGLAAANAVTVSAPSRDQILADFAQLDLDEQNADIQAAIARVNH